MCSLFGLIDYDGVLTTKQKNRILNILARESECRGTDATGIAYHFNDRLRIYKRPMPAHRLKLHIPYAVKVVMGHTRMTTQGNAHFNANNHPFIGTIGGKSFALAHNGVLWNDRELQCSLPKTNIQTDSYVAAQLLEQQKSLDFVSLKNMAETVEGSFVFTVLDAKDAVWIVKGDNPLLIVRYNGFLLYASTREIMQSVIRKLHLGRPTECLEPKEGEILRIDSEGRVMMGSFTPHHTYQHWWRYPPYYGSFRLEEEPIATDSLIDAAKSMGISQDEVRALLDYGCTSEEIEELLYDPALLRELTAELLYAY